MLNHTYTSVKNAKVVDCGKKEKIPSQPFPLLRDNFLGEYRTELDKKKVLANYVAEDGTVPTFETVEEAAEYSDKENSREKNVGKGEVNSGKENSNKENSHEVNNGKENEDTEVTDPQSLSKMEEQEPEVNIFDSDIQTVQEEVKKAEQESEVDKTASGIILAFINRGRKLSVIQ